MKFIALLLLLSSCAGAWRQKVMIDGGNETAVDGFNPYLGLTYQVKPLYNLRLGLWQSAMDEETLSPYFGFSWNVEPTPFVFNPLPE